MKVFALTGVKNENMCFVVKNELDLYTIKYDHVSADPELLRIDPPELELRSNSWNQEKYKGRAKQVPDIGYFTPGGVICNQKTVDLIGDYLRQFGDLITTVVEGETWYSYLVTNILEGVVDEKRSKYSNSGFLRDVCFVAEKLPRESQIFRIKENMKIQIYFNTNGGESVKSLIEKYELNAGNIPLIWDAERGHVPEVSVV